MKKVLALVLMATTFVACGKSELEEVNNIYEEISAAKDEKKEDPNFRIFKDHYQKGKGETK